MVEKMEETSEGGVRSGEVECLAKGRNTLFKLRKDNASTTNRDRKKRDFP